MNWIGKPIAKNRPHNFFKTDYKQMPAYMFKDSDKDGVANVFDCKPYDKNRQGFIDAMIGAAKGIGKGGVKAGWKEGMAKQGNPVTRRLFRPKETRQQTLQRMGVEAQPVYPIDKYYPKTKRIVRTDFDNLERGNAQPSVLQRMPTMDEDMAQLNAIEQEKARIAGRTEAIKRLGGKNLDYIKEKANRLLLALKRSNPKYDVNMEFRGRKIAQLKRDIASGQFSGRQLAKMKRQLAGKQAVQEQRAYQLSKIARGQAQKTAIKGIATAFPMVTPMSGTHVMGAPGQRGRPRGSLDPRYAQYGGVYGYRKALAAQKRAYKMAMQQQQIQMKQQRAMAQAPYEYDQSTMSEATAISGPIQEQQIPQQMPQYPQQYPQEPQKRPIATVFKGSGGSPYPPVDTRPLTPSRQTIQQGYVESVDSFTGRRFMKKLPPTERWSGGDY